MLGFGSAILGKYYFVSCHHFLDIEDFDVTVKLLFFFFWCHHNLNVVGQFGQFNIELFLGFGCFWAKSFGFQCRMFTVKFGTTSGEVEVLGAYLTVILNIIANFWNVGLHLQILNTQSSKLLKHFENNSPLFGASDFRVKPPKFWGFVAKTSHRILKIWVFWVSRLILTRYSIFWGGCEAYRNLSLWG